MYAEQGRIICLELLPDDVFKAKAVNEFLQQEQTSIGRNIASGKIKFQRLIALGSDSR